LFWVTRIGASLICGVKRLLEILMRRAIIILSSVMLCRSVFGAPEDDPARVYADSMAQAIVANRDAVLLENFAPIMLSNYTQADLLSPLGAIRNEFGTISEYEFRNSTVGGRIVANQNIRTATCWYALVTTKIPSGLFMKVEVTYADRRFYLAGYSVTRFVGNDIPPALQKHVP
jgi:hypothetical protein